MLLTEINVSLALTLYRMKRKGFLTNLGNRVGFHVGSQHKRDNNPNKEYAEINQNNAIGVELANITAKSASRDALELLGKYGLQSVGDESVRLWLLLIEKYFLLSGCN